MPSSEGETKPPLRSVAAGKFEIDKRLGAGCFGEVWRGYNKENRETVAVKFERHDGHALQLEHEYDVLKQLAGTAQHPQGFAECYYWGHEGRYHCMVMELLGRSLEERLQACNGRFKVESAVLIAEQVLHRIEYLHSKGIIHRDIKPENFMFGVKNKIHHIYLIDFGLSKKYWDNGKHSSQRHKLSLTGTARYASINAHRGVEQSRRDDLEAIGHMLIYFLRGSLPWSGLDAKTQEEKYRKIREKKEEVQLSDLCAGQPDAFKNYLSTTRNLEFKERPDYKGLRALFRSERDKKSPPLEDHGFEWFENKDFGGQLVPLTFPEPRQPDDADPAQKKKGGFWPSFCCGSSSNVRD